MILESTFRAHDHASKSGELLFIAHEYDSGIYFLFSFWAHDHGGLIVNRAQGSFYPSSGSPQSLSQFTPKRGKQHLVQIQ